jgi:hypothetical protein
MKLSAHLARLLAVTVALILALGVAACGDSEDGDGGDGPSASATATSTTGDRTTPENRTAPDDQDETGSTDDGVGDDADGAEPSDDAPATDDGPSDEARVAAVVEGMYRDFANADAAGVCSVMSETVQKQIAENAAIEAVEKRTCTASLGNFLSAAKRSGALAQARGAKVGEVKVDGDTATAVISLGGRSGKIKLVKENGEWHFGAAPLGGQTGS